jgi:hypothetical protein
MLLGMGLQKQYHQMKADRPDLGLHLPAGLTASVSLLVILRSEVDRYDFRRPRTDEFLMEKTVY